jgi:hypothetical protein
MLKIIIGFALGATLSMAVAKGPCYLQFDPNAPTTTMPTFNTLSSGGRVQIPCPADQQ